ncbi:MAG: hypothetical protein PHI96_07455, partial [Desulfovibrio sp.]|nr:hypothetical protein [Desulfovibrio sp.]
VTGRGYNDVFFDGSGSVNIEGELYGMNASGASAFNTINLDSGSVNVSANQSAVMSAVNNGHNEISATGSVTVSITATTDAAGKAIAMWASGGGSLNIIEGGQNSSVNVTAQDGQGMAMSASSGGRNEISLGSGSQVTIQGNVNTDGNAASENKIVVSGSGNTVTVAGNVAAGSLNIVANADNTFTLILQASDMNEFASRYADWLNGLTDLDFFAGLTSVQFQIDGAWSGADEAALRGALSGFLDKVDGDKVSFTEPDAQPETFSAAFEDGLGHDGLGLHDSGEDFGPQQHNFDISANNSLLFASDDDDSLEGDAYLYDDAMAANYSETGARETSQGEPMGSDSHEGYSTPPFFTETSDMLQEGDNSLDSVLQPALTVAENTEGHEADAIELIDLTNTDALKDASKAVATADQPQPSFNEDFGASVSTPEGMNTNVAKDVSDDVTRQMVENS